MLAKKIAKKRCNKNKKWKFCSIIVSSGRVMSIGTNKTYKTHPFQLKSTLSANLCNKSGFLVNRIHSEIDCLKSMKRSIPSNSTLYISRSDNNPSYPCELCLNVIKSTNGPDDLLKFFIFL